MRRLHCHPVLAGITFLLLTFRSLGAPALPATREAFLQATNVWEIHLHLSAADWKAMEPTNAPGGPQGPQGPRGPGGPGGPGGPDGPRGPRNPQDPDGPRRADGPGNPNRPPNGPGPRLLPPGGFQFPWTTGVVEVAGVRFTNVGVRFKGNSSYNGSRNSHKRPFKLDFDRHVPDRTLAGLEELFLNNNVNDPSQLRETLAYAAFNRAGVPAPRTAYARVWLTLDDATPREYLGLYTIIEPIEGDFLKQRLGTSKGLLVKPERTRGLEYLGSRWSDYTNRYEPRSKVRVQDTERFIQRLQAIHEADAAHFPAAVTNALDPDALLRFVAVTAWLSSYDSMIGNGHNYYLFLDSRDGRLRFLPWDLNEAFGRHPGAGPEDAQAAFSILTPYTPSNPFLDRIFAHPPFATRYRSILAELQSGACSTNALLKDFHQVQAAVETFVKAEPAGNMGRMGPMGPRGPMGPPDPNRPIRPMGPMSPMSPMNTTPLSTWIQLRHDNIAGELTGTRTAPRAELRRMGGGGGPPFGGR